MYRIDSQCYYLILQVIVLHIVGYFIFTLPCIVAYSMSFEINKENIGPLKAFKNTNLAYFSLALQCSTSTTSLTLSYDVLNTSRELAPV